MLIKAGEIPEVFNQDELFGILKGMIESGDMSVNCDGALVSEGIQLPTIPNSVERYVEFLEGFKALNHCKHMTFTRDGCQRFDPSILSAAYHFLSPYIKAKGVPSKGINAVFIGGDYQETWIGLHNDYCQTFLFPVLGKKKMYMWHPDYFSNIEELMYEGFNGTCLGKINITQYKKDALIFDMEAGDLLYIPPHWWHYNLLDQSQPTITISLGLFTHNDDIDYIKTVLNTLEKKTTETECSSYFFNEKVNSERIIDNFEQEFGPTLEKLRNSLLCDYVHKHSFKGFVAVEQYLAEVTDSNTAYRLPSYCTICYQKQENNDILLFLSGKQYRFPYCETTLKTLETLNCGQPVTFDERSQDLYSILKQHRRLAPAMNEVTAEKATEFGNFQCSGDKNYPKP
ncbi:cupin domain-containing protein [Vibrio ostreicida]|uniref:Cupin domain-containing protein n=2 Tax=Vibrio ostreicida TaxID=526588 RepID=A0ABT8BUR7_9VIBR|nr:cupin-like domain-containing protein [Vibrio ostreicida]MDN3610449.1 cupin domain-containing protein [Vibrio ostreicida]